MLSSATREINRLWQFVHAPAHRLPSRTELLETEVEELRNACEQAHLLLDRERFKDDHEARLVQVVLKNALSRVDYR